MQHIKTAACRSQKEIFKREGPCSRIQILFGKDFCLSAHLQQSEDNNRLYRPALLVGAVFALLLALWWSLDHSYPIWDAGSHFQDAIKYAELIRHPKLLNGKFWQEFLTVNFNYPLTQHFIYGLSKALFGCGRFSDALVNLLFSLTLSIALALLTKFCGGSKKAMALSIALINFYPATIQFSHSQMLDFGHLALSALALAALAAFQQKQSGKTFLFLALALALGATAKQAAAVFLVAPSLFLLLYSIKQGNWRAVAGLATAGGITALALLLWILPNYKALKDWRDYYQPQTGASLGAAGQAPVFFEHLRLYLEGLVGLMSPLLLGLFLIALAVSFRRFKKRSLVENLLLTSAVSGIPLMSILAMNNAEARYVMPVLTWAAVQSALLLETLLEKGKLTSLLAACTIALAFTQYAVLSFCPYPLALGKEPTAAVKKLAMAEFDFTGPPFSPSPPDDPWGQHWLIENIEKDAAGKPVFLNLLPSTRELSVHTLTVAFKLESKQPVAISTFRRFTLNGDVFEYSPEQLAFYQYYLVKDGYNGKPLLDEGSSKNWETLLKALTNKEKYVELGRRTLSDGSEMRLYKRIF